MIVKRLSFRLSMNCGKNESFGNRALTPSTLPTTSCVKWPIWRSVHHSGDCYTEILHRHSRAFMQNILNLSVGNLQHTMKAQALYHKLLLTMKKQPSGRNISLLITKRHASCLRP